MEAARAARERELTARLEALGEVLGEGLEPPLALPPGAAAAWTEAQVRAFFASLGAAAPALPGGDHGGGGVVPGQPGGGVEQTAPGPEAPEGLREARMVATAAAYREQALKDGIPDRPRGLFPPGDPVLGALHRDPDLRPFQKHLCLPDGRQALAERSWGVGDHAAAAGMDLRYFLDTRAEAAADARGVGHRLVGAVRFGDGASIGQFWTTAHGGSVETCLDEATAELVKITKAAVAATSEIRFKIVKPVPLHRSLRVDCAVVAAQGPLKTVVDGKLLGPDGTVFATCSATLVDMGLFYKKYAPPDPGRAAR